MSKEIKHISGAAGGYLVGNSHDNGGIQAINKAIGKPLEMEGGEVVITKPAVEDTELREFEGNMLTNRQILSKINESGGGVSFAEKGAELPTKIEFCGTEYKYGGETLTDYEIAHRISKCGCSHEEDSYADGGETEKRTTAIKTTSLKHYKELLAKGVKAELVTKQDLNKLEKGGNLEKELKDNAINVAVNATETLPIMEKGGETSSNEIMELVISPDNNLSKQLKEQTGDYWNAHDFANIDESITDLSFMKPFYHKETGKKFVVIDPSMQPKPETIVKPIFTSNFLDDLDELDLWKQYRDGRWYRKFTVANDENVRELMDQGIKERVSDDNKGNITFILSVVNSQEAQRVSDLYMDLYPIKGTKINNRKPKYNVGDYVSYTSGDIEIEKWQGIVKEVKDFDTEYAYRLDAYTTDVDPPMFDSEKTNERYEVSLKASTKVNFNKAKAAYEWYKENLYKNRSNSENSDKFTYQMLSRLQNDNNYYLGNGGRHEKHLWAKNVKDQISEMKRLWESLEIKPEWLSMEDIINYENQMTDSTTIQQSTKTYNVTDYKNPYEVNRAIEALLDSKNDKEDFNSNEIEFISHYSGYGGLAKYGEFTQEEITKILSEFFTPEEVVKKMWALAYKYGFGVIENPKVLEPSVGTGNFFKYAPKNAELYANEINRYSKEICEILYPEANVSLQYFEQNFLEKNNSIKNKIQKLQKYDLVIGNPPYGRLGGKFMNMGEDTYTKASTFTEYFILRGLDLLKPGGLLIYIVGAEQYNGGTLFLDSKPNFAKKQIADKAQLIDAYRLPIKIFERTGVSSEIVVFKKN